MDSTLIVPKEEPATDSDLDVDPEYSPGTRRGDQNIEIVTKFKDELTSEELKDFEDSQGQFEEIIEGSYILSEVKVKDEPVFQDDFPIIAADPEDPNWDCPICRKQKPVHMELKEHLASHFTSEKSQNEPRCPICGIEFNRLVKVYSHIAVAHKNDGKEVDIDPDKDAKNQEDCDSNESDENASEIESDDNVSSEYEEEATENIIEHEKRKGVQKSTDSPKFKCETCLKGFPNIGTLVEHRRRYHTKERPFKCSICELSFFTINDRKYHMAVHSEQRPFRCKTCGREFKWQGNLRAHVANHSVRKWCNKCDQEVLNWKEHQNSCVRKAFPCSECPKSYNSSKQLISHTSQYHCKDNIHNKCPLCKKVFATPSSMQLHLNVTHSKKRPFACSVCEKKFKRSFEVTKHMKAVHKEKE